LGFNNPFKEFSVFYFIGMFFNLFAPSTVGGDVGRVIYLTRRGSNTIEQRWADRTGAALSSVVADRAIGMSVMIWVAATAVAVFPMYSLPPAVHYLTMTLALGVLFGWWLLPLLGGLLQRFIKSMGKSLAVAIEAYTSERRLIFKAIILSLAVHFSQATSQVFVGWSLDLNIPWSYAFILYPLVALFSAIPISFNGVGLREGGYLFMLKLIGVGSEKAVAFGILWFVVVVLNSMIGGVVFILNKNRELPIDVSVIGDQTR
jgi:uncharacterized membrane protein YbhN (UPF0104 family)